MRTINFTEEHLKRTKELYLDLGFSGDTLEGKFGTNQYTPWHLLHNTTTNTLRSINNALKKEVKLLEEQDEWSLSTYKQTKANKTKKWQEFINLLIGYKLNKEIESENRIQLRNEKERKLAVLKQLKDEAEIKALGNLTPEELQKQIDELE